MKAFFLAGSAALLLACGVTVSPAMAGGKIVNLTLRVVLAAVLAPRLGIRMVWYAVPVGWAANYLISFLRYRTGRWRERGAGLLA